MRTVLRSWRTFLLSKRVVRLDAYHYREVLIPRIGSRDSRVVGGLYETTETDLEIECYPPWKTEKVYICPRGIESHQGKPQNFGRQCQNAKGVEGNTYVEHGVLKVLTVWKRIVFDQNMSMAERE